MFSLEYVAGLWAAKSESVRLSVRAVSKISNLCGPDPPSQTDRRTDGQTDGHHASRGKTVVYCSPSADGDNGVHDIA